MAAKTKIIATVGPASDSPEMLAKLVEAGVRIFRLNFSHGDASSFVEIIKNIRTIEAEKGFPITIMQDLAGPKIRIGTLDVDSITFAKGDEALLGPVKPEGTELPYLPFDHPSILKTLEIGDRLVLADGTLQFRVTRKMGDELFVVQAGNAGLVTSRKGLALPDKSIPVPALTDKDKKNLRDALDLGIDAVALSFVQTAQDILDAKEIIRAAGKDIPVVAKLERRNAVNNLESILEVVDIIMVARGDLGIECPLPALPAMQKRIISACNKAAKPVIVATQMLLSMVNNPSPTRAETTDVANAVLDGADCVMLSEETAMGNFPAEAVRFMAEIATQAEKLLEDQKKKQVTTVQTGVTVTGFLANSACLLADAIHADAIVAYSVSGDSARTVAAHRPAQPLYAVSPFEPTLHTLNFSWGVQPCRIELDHTGHLESAEKFIDTSHLFQRGASVIITAGQKRSGQSQQDPLETIGTNVIKVVNK
ncbi:pyruvate kinase [Desulfovibrio sp. OttesenSCG-928-I05]|nr:pyruvate kinase [Desulfovibrio sp. OttesenSCG-928-I05]